MTRPHITHRGFDTFSRGRFEDGGANLYVNAKGVIESIHRTDVNHDGYVDLIFPNAHGYIERGPTWIYKPKLDAKADAAVWPRTELPNDSGWTSRVIDVDGDGHNDLIVVNAENGVTSELTSYVYWGGPDGLTGDRTEFSTIGAYDVAAVDLNGDGLLTLIFPSAWVDHHNAGEPKPIQVFVQTKRRVFSDATASFELTGIAATSVACGDLTGNGRADLVVANYRNGFEYDTDSFIYPGTPGGFDGESPFRLPTHYAMQVMLADLDGDGLAEIIFAGGDQVMVYWNDHGRFSADRRTLVEARGFSTIFCIGAVRADVADVDGDGKPELLIAGEDGVQIRSADDLQTVRQTLEVPYASWVHAADLDGDGRPELIVSKYDNRVTYETESVIFWNTVDGYSQDRCTALATKGAMGCTAGDIDGDGKPEVIFNSTMAGPSQFWPDFPLYIYLGGKDADYGPHRRLELPVGDADGYILADLRLTGYHDLVVGLRIFHGGPDGLSADRYSDLIAPFAGPIMYTLVADVNRDGYLDLIVMVQTYDDKPQTMAESTRVFFGSPDGYSVENSMVLPTYCTGQGHLADLDASGYVDLVTSEKDGTLLIFHGGPGGFSPDRTSRIALPVPGASTINSADLTGNGYLDLIIAVASHYHRGNESILILYGAEDGFTTERSQQYDGRYTPGRIGIADYDRDGHLDLLVGAYSSHVTRVLPAKLFRGDGKRIDLDNPYNIHADAAYHIMAMDLSRNGYLDLIFACHRNDLGHQVDSLIFWNGPEGISWNRVSRLPTMGPHSLCTRDYGNAYTRRPVESYVSPPIELDAGGPISLHWDAHVPPDAQIRFQVRSSVTTDQLDQAPWCGPDGGATYYQTSGEKIRGLDAGCRFLQYRAEFISLYGCNSVQLRQVDIAPCE